MPRGGRRQCAVTEEDAAAEARRMVDSYVYVKQGALYEEEEEEVVKEEEEEDVCEEKCLKAAYRAIWQPPRQRQRKRRRALRLPAIEFCEVDFELPPEVYAEVVENREAEAARSGGNREPEVAMREFELVRRNVVEERSRSGEVTGKCGCGPESLCREGGCPNRAAFIECAPETCDLGKACQNRRLQRCRGAARGLEVRPAGPKGLGLFAARHYEPGDLVGEYLGEVMDSAKYASLARSRRERHCYFMRLGDHVIDASRKGGLCRFLNHSCAPNAEAERWSVNGDRRVAITVVTPIAPGDEITIDYDWKGAEDGRPCHCGAPTCRGLMASEFNNVEEEEEEEEEEQQQDRPHSWEALAEMLHAWNNPRSFVLEVQSQPDDGTTPEEEEEEEEEEETPDECGVEEDDNDDDTTPEEEEEDEEAFCPRRSLRLKAAAAARERPYLPHREDSPEEETDDEDSREQTGESPEEETEESHQKDARPKAVDPRRRRAALVVREELSETSSSEETSDQAPRVSDDVSPVAEDSLPAANDAAFAPPPPVIKPTKAVLDAAKRRADYLRRANVTLPEPVAPAAPPVDNDDVVLEPQARQLLAALPASYVEKIKARIRDGEIKNPCSYIVRAERKVRDLAARAREEVPPLEDDEAFSRLDLAAKRTLASLPPEDIQDIKHKLQNGEIRYPKSYIIRAARRLRAKFDALEPPPAEPDDDDNDLVISDLLDPRASAALASMPEKTAGKIKRKLRDGGIRDPRSYILKVRGNAEVLEAVREQEKAALLEVPEDENHLDGDDPGKVDDDPLAGLDDEVKEALAELPANYQEKIQRKMREGKVRTPTSYILNIRRTYRRESDESSPRDGRGAAAFDDDDDDDFASLDAETKDALFSFPQNDIQSIRRKHRKGEIHVLKNYIIQAYRNFQERLKTDRILVDSRSRGRSASRSSRSASRGPSPDDSCNRSSPRAHHRRRQSRGDVARRGDDDATRVSSSSSKRRDDSKRRSDGRLDEEDVRAEPKRRPRDDDSIGRDAPRKHHRARWFEPRDSLDKVDASTERRPRDDDDDDGGERDKTPRKPRADRREACEDEVDASTERKRRPRDDNSGRDESRKSGTGRREPRDTCCFDGDNASTARDDDIDGADVCRERKRRPRDDNSGRDESRKSRIDRRAARDASLDGVNANTERKRRPRDDDCRRGERRKSGADRCQTRDSGLDGANARTERKRPLQGDDSGRDEADASTERKRRPRDDDSGRDESRKSRIDRREACDDDHFDVADASIDRKRRPRDDGGRNEPSRKPRADRREVCGDRFDEDVANAPPKRLQRDDIGRDGADACTERKNSGLDYPLRSGAERREPLDGCLDDANANTERERRPRDESRRVGADANTERERQPRDDNGQDKPRKSRADRGQAFDARFYEVDASTERKRRPRHESGRDESRKPRAERLDSCDDCFDDADASTERERRPRDDGGRNEPSRKPRADRREVCGSRLDEDIANEPPKRQQQDDIERDGADASTERNRGTRGDDGGKDDPRKSGADRREPLDGCVDDADVGSERKRRPRNESGRGGADAGTERKRRPRDDGSGRADVSTEGKRQPRDNRGRDEPREPRADRRQSCDARLDEADASTERKRRPQEKSAPDEPHEPRADRRKACDDRFDDVDATHTERKRHPRDDSGRDESHQPRDDQFEPRRPRDDDSGRDDLRKSGADRLDSPRDRCLDDANASTEHKRRPRGDDSGQDEPRKPRAHRRKSCNDHSDYFVASVASKRRPPEPRDDSISRDESSKSGADRKKFHDCCVDEADTNTERRTQGDGSGQNEPRESGADQKEPRDGCLDEANADTERKRRPRDNAIRRDESRKSGAGPCWSKSRDSRVEEDVIFTEGKRGPRDYCGLDDPRKSRAADQDKHRDDCLDEDNAGAARKHRSGESRDATSRCYESQKPRTDESEPLKGRLRESGGVFTGRKRRPEDCSIGQVEPRKPRADRREPCDDSWDDIAVITQRKRRPRNEINGYRKSSKSGADLSKPRDDQLDEDNVCTARKRRPRDDNIEDNEPRKPRAHRTEETDTNTSRVRPSRGESRDDDSRRRESRKSRSYRSKDCDDRLKERLREDDVLTELEHRLLREDNRRCHESRMPRASRSGDIFAEDENDASTARKPRESSRDDVRRRKPRADGGEPCDDVLDEDDSHAERARPARETSRIERNRQNESRENRRRKSRGDEDDSRAARKRKLRESLGNRPHRLGNDDDDEKRAERKRRPREYEYDIDRQDISYKTKSWRYSGRSPGGDRRARESQDSSSGRRRERINRWPETSRDNSIGRGWVDDGALRKQRPRASRDDHELSDNSRERVSHLKGDDAGSRRNEARSSPRADRLELVDDFLVDDDVNTERRPRESREDGRDASRNKRGRMSRRDSGGIDQEDDAFEKKRPSNDDERCWTREKGTRAKYKVLRESRDDNITGGVSNSKRRQDSQQKDGMRKPRAHLSESRDDDCWMMEDDRVPRESEGDSRGRRGSTKKRRRDALDRSQEFDDLGREESSRRPNRKPRYYVVQDEERYGEPRDVDNIDEEQCRVRSSGGRRHSTRVYSRRDDRFSAEIDELPIDDVAKEALADVPKTAEEVDGRAIEVCRVRERPSARVSRVVSNSSATGSKWSSSSSKSAQKQAPGQPLAITLPNAQH